MPFLNAFKFDASLKSSGKVKKYVCVFQDSALKKTRYGRSA